MTLAVVAGEDQAAFEDRLRAAGWQPVYHDDDGTVLTSPDRPAHDRTARGGASRTSPRDRGWY